MDTTPAIRRARRSVGRPAAVSINGAVISSASIAREAQHHASSDPDEAWMLAARALAIRELLRQEAERLGITAEPIEDGEGRRETPDEARLRGLIEREVAVPRADEATCRRYYQANLARFRSPDLFEVAHILIAAAPADAEARAKARPIAEALLAELRQRPEDFAAAAGQLSACPSARQGGNLGQIGPGQTVAEFEQALGRMTAGTVHAELVESRYGFHIVRLDRRIEGRHVPFELVQERIAAYLEEAVHRRALRQYVAILAGRAQVTGVDFGVSHGSLVQ